MIAVSCPHCGAQLKVPDDRAGRKGVCAACNGKVWVPGPSTPHSDTPGPGGAPPKTPDARLHLEPEEAEPCSAEDYKFLNPPRLPGELGRLGPYRILKVLGVGGMGIVFEAEDTQLKRRVALKALKPAMVVEEGNRQRFIREAQAAASIDHEHIVTIYQVGEDSGVPYLAMKLLEGESLEMRLQREGGWLPLTEALRIGREVAEGLDVAHQKNLVHRDIKPGNIWLEQGRDRVRIVDFGLARPMTEESKVTQTGFLIGTPSYMAPEQADGLDVDHRADLFSLGCVLYRMSTGRLPFTGKGMLAILKALATHSPEPPRAIDSSLPEAFSDLVMSLLAKNLNDRPRTANEVARALEAIERAQAGGGVAVPTEKQAPPPKLEREASAAPTDALWDAVEALADEEVAARETSVAADEDADTDSTGKPFKVLENDDAPAKKSRRKRPASKTYAMVPPKKGKPGRKPHVQEDEAEERMATGEKGGDNGELERKVLVGAALVGGAVVLLILFLILRRFL